MSQPDSESSSGSEITSCEIIHDEEHDEYVRAESDVSTEADDVPDAYADEPLADEVWLAEYLKNKEEEERQMEEFQKRLGLTATDSWCKCGNCNTELLTNAKEVKCCKEIEGCLNALRERRVFEEVGQEPPCIVNHPGFGAVCLNVWSLKLSASMFKTRNEKKYQKDGSEERFLRSVSYRQFTRMVHGILRDKRIPLPACAYHAIRSAFKIADENFEGYDDNNM